MGDLIQAGFGLLILIGFWYAVFAVIRLLEPRPRAPRHPAPPPASPDISTGQPLAHAGRTPALDGPQSAHQKRTRGAPRPRRCCPDCAPGCQIAGLVMGQQGGRGDDLWGQPFGDDGPNIQAVVFWGDGCCPDCERCPTCQGA